MKLQGKIAKIAIATLVAGAVALPAASASARTTNTERALIGGLLGAVAGAAFSNGDGGATAIGAVAGAALGASTGRDNRYYDRGYRAPPRQYYQDTRYGYDQRAYNPGYYGGGRNDRYNNGYGYNGYYR